MLEATVRPWARTSVPAPRVQVGGVPRRNLSPAAVTAKTLVINFLLAVAFVLASDAANTVLPAFYAGRAFLLLALVASLFARVETGARLLLLIGISGQAIIDSETVGDGFTLASIWLFRLGALNPTWIIVACLLVQLLKCRQLIVDAWERLAVGWFLTVPILMGIVGNGLHSDDPLGRIAADVKLGLMLLPSVFVYRSVLRSDARQLGVLLSTLTGALLARHLLDFVYAFSDVGPSFGLGNVVSLDPAKGLVIYLLFLAALGSAIHGRIIVPLVLGAAASFLLVAYSTRLLYVTAFLGAFLLVPLVPLRRLVLAAGMAAIPAVAGIALLVVCRPDTALGAWYRLETLTRGRDEFSVDVEYNLFSRIDPVRYAEFLNIQAANESWATIALGNGYGSYYTDDEVRFPTHLTAAFPAEDLVRGTYFYAHDYALHIYFKHGVVGLILISGLWVIPVFRILRRVRRQQARLLAERDLTVICVLALVPFSVTGMLALYWSGKGLLCSGLMLAALKHFEDTGGQLRQRSAGDPVCTLAPGRAPRRGC